MPPYAPACMKPLLEAAPEKWCSVIASCGSITYSYFSSESVPGGVGWSVKGRSSEEITRVEVFKQGDVCVEVEAALLVLQQLKLVSLGAKTAVRIVSSGFSCFIRFGGFSGLSGYWVPCRIHRSGCGETMRWTRLYKRALKP